jgi:hypothetical protein
VEFLQQSYFRLLVEMHFSASEPMGRASHQELLDLVMELMGDASH